MNDVTVSARPGYRATQDDDFYWERVNRSLGWLGDSESEQAERQRLLRSLTVGVAGCGGIGGMARIQSENRSEHHHRAAKKGKRATDDHYYG